MRKNDVKIGETYVTTHGGQVEIIQATTCEVAAASYGRRKASGFAVKSDRAFQTVRFPSGHELAESGLRFIEARYLSRTAKEEAALRSEARLLSRVRDLHIEANRDAELDMIGQPDYEVACIVHRHVGLLDETTPAVAAKTRWPKNCSPRYARGVRRWWTPK